MRCYRVVAATQQQVAAAQLPHMYAQGTPTVGVGSQQGSFSVSDTSCVWQHVATLSQHYSNPCVSPVCVCVPVFRCVCVCV